MKTIIHTSAAPEPIGPYSQAVRAGATLYLSGQIALSNGILIQDSIASEATQVMKNIEAVLRQAGMQFENIVKTTIFLTNLGNFDQVNEIYGSYFKSDFPARETVEVSKLPKGAQVEISVIAVK